jgi:ketosteroid isomerase-like protein
MAPATPNEELTRKIVDRWNEGDRDALLQVIDPDTELHSRLGELRGRPYIGPDGFREWTADIDEQFSGFHISVTKLEERKPGWIIADGSVELRGRGSDLPWKQETIWVLEIDEGRLRRMEIFTDREAGLRAIGQS